MSMQTLNLVSLVSQTTFALTMALLAWSDRRSRGMAWLASASVMVLLSTTFRYILPKDPYHISDAVGTGLVLLIFFCAHQGLYWFIDRREQRASKLPLITSAGVALVSFISIPAPALATNISRVLAAGIICVTIRMLLQPHIRALRIASRLCAIPLGLMACLLLSRSFIDQFLQGARHDLLSTYTREAGLLIVLTMMLSFIGLFVAENNRRLHEETRKDSLTGLNNRRAMEECAAREIEYAQEHSAPLSLLMMDMDHFKRINDTWGHWFGDRALHALGLVLLTNTRTTDTTARIGGEEFAVLLPGRNMEEASIAAERLRGAVENISLHEAECNASLTVSIGISMLKPGEKNWSDMLRRADKALYRAKRQGRNRVVLHSDEVTSIDSMDHATLFRPSGRKLTGTGGRRRNR